jgi:hypothetical protein
MTARCPPLTRPSRTPRAACGAVLATDHRPLGRLHSLVARIPAHLPSLLMKPATSRRPGTRRRVPQASRRRIQPEPAVSDITPNRQNATSTTSPWIEVRLISADVTATDLRARKIHRSAAAMLRRLELFRLEQRRRVEADGATHGWQDSQRDGAEQEGRCREGRGVRGLHDVIWLRTSNRTSLAVGDRHRRARLGIGPIRCWRRSGFGDAGTGPAAASVSPEPTRLAPLSFL